MITAYISIGNSDDKLSQAEWSSFVRFVDRAFDDAVRYEGAHVHGRWHSLPTEPWQNACWCAEWHDDLAHVVEAFKRRLSRVARTYRQDSIAWAEVKDTEFLRDWRPGDRCKSCMSEETYLNDDGHPACRGCGASDSDE